MPAGPVAPVPAGPAGPALPSGRPRLPGPPALPACWAGRARGPAGPRRSAGPVVPRCAWPSRRAGRTCCALVGPAGPVARCAPVLPAALPALPVPPPLRAARAGPVPGHTVLARPVAAQVGPDEPERAGRGVVAAGVDTVRGGDAGELRPARALLARGSAGDACRGQHRSQCRSGPDWAQRSDHRPQWRSRDRLGSSASTDVRRRPGDSCEVSNSAGYRPVGTFSVPAMIFAL